MCAGGSAELRGDRVQHAMRQSMQKGFGDVSEIHQKSMEVDNAGSYDMMVFEQLNLNVNSRALAKLLSDNPEQPDTSILSDKPTETLPPDMILERD